MPVAQRTPPSASNRWAKRMPVGTSSWWCQSQANAIFPPQLAGMCFVPISIQLMLLNPLLFVLLGVGYLANDTDSVNYFGECISIIIGVCCGFAALLLVLAARFASTPASAALRAYYEEEFMRTPPAPSTAAVAPVTPQHGRDVV